MLGSTQVGSFENYISQPPLQLTVAAWLSLASEKGAQPRFGKELVLSLHVKEKRSQDRWCSDKDSQISAYLWKFTWERNQKVFFDTAIVNFESLL
jgi:hypothetical protein